MKFFIFIAAVYFILNLLILWRSLKWLGLCSEGLQRRWFKIVYSVFYIILATTLVTANFINVPTIKGLLKYISNIWIGVFIYAIVFMFIWLIISFCVRAAGGKDALKSKGVLLARGALIGLCVIGLSVYGTLHAGSMITTNYSVDINKNCGGRDQLKVVLIADTHMGYTVGTEQIKKMVDAVNKQQPDLVCFAGDIFDNDYDAMAEPELLIQELKQINSRYGVYACYGNHDAVENLAGGFTIPSKTKAPKDRRMTAFLKKAEIKMMKDDVELIDKDFYLIGRLDYTKPGTKNGKRKTIEQLTAGLNKKKPIILMDHQPKDLQENANNGIDLELSGHTHNGQIFPGNLTIKLFWENAYGYLRKDKMHSIVTSGVGVWGPAMRSGSTAEVVSIKVKFKK